MTYYVGQEAIGQGLLGEGNVRYFYGMRRTDDGVLYFTKVDQLADNDTAITVNNPGLAENDFEEFEYGVDYFDGRLADDHSRPYSNLYFDQYRWDTVNAYYYINGNGELIVRLNKAYTYSVDQIVTP